MNPWTAWTFRTRAAVAGLVVRASAGEQAVTVVLVAHDVNPILPYLDRVVYLARGGAMAGLPSEVIASETLTALFGTPVEVLQTRPTAGWWWSAAGSPAHHTDRHAVPPGERMVTDASAGLLAGGQGASWNLAADLHLLLSQPFMVNALRAGTIVAVLAGALGGWFMVMRHQSFAGHTLAVVSGFPERPEPFWSGSAPPSATSRPRSPGRWSLPCGPDRPPGGNVQPGVGGHRDRASSSRWPAVPCSSASMADSSTASRTSSSAPFWASPTGRSSSCCWWPSPRW